jgi:hypothetical protein
MNERLAQATTSVAFLLNLSRRQCNSLLRLKEFATERGDFAMGDPNNSIVQVDGLKGLESRGLVWWERDSNGVCCGFRGMTKAGKLVAELLVEAGLTVDNTNTGFVLRRLERIGA